MGLNGHSRMHGNSGGTTTYPNNVCCIYTGKIIAARNLESYQETILGTMCSIHSCEGCGKFISTKKKYCSQSCSTSVTNRKRLPKSDDTKNKISEAVSMNYILNSKRLFIGPHTKIHQNTCSICHHTWFWKYKIIICEDCKSNTELQSYKRKQRNKFLFKFDTNNHPDLFDLDQINKIGWYAPAKKVDRNLNGLTRDHIISVAESITNNYDPYYITHPMNCRIMTQSENSKKNTKSHMSYDKLKVLVELYDKLKL